MDCTMKPQLIEQRKRDLQTPINNCQIKIKLFFKSTNRKPFIAIMAHKRFTQCMLKSVSNIGYGILLIIKGGKKLYSEELCQPKLTTTKQLKLTHILTPS